MTEQSLLARIDRLESLDDIRLPCYWYATDINQLPVGEKKMRWRDRDSYAGAYPALWPRWEEFWANPPDSSESQVAAPLEQFLTRMRRGASDPNIRVR